MNELHEKFGPNSYPPPEFTRPIIHWPLAFGDLRRRSRPHLSPPGASWTVAACVAVGLCTLGCSQRNRSADDLSAPLIVAVAPVLNFSNRSDWDPVRVTDLVASELTSLPGYLVVPVNRVRAALELTGRSVVTTPQDALELAALVGADATLVAAVTEYDPYSPITIGWTLQWYERREHAPLAESGELRPLGPAPAPAAALPAWQFQHIYRAADEQTRRDVRRLAQDRPGYDSPHDWKTNLYSQERFIRSSIRSAFESISTAAARAVLVGDEAWR